MKHDRTRQQFRLTWNRGETVCAKTFATRAKAERHIRILTADEPWREWAPKKGPDDYVCCRDSVYSECGCGGLTCAQERDEKRKDLPPINWIRIEQRTITSTPFTDIDRITVSSPRPLLAREGE